LAGGARAPAAGSGLLGASGNFWVMCAASALLGLGIGAAMTASFSAAGRVIPVTAHGTGFGVLTSASLVGMASSPFIAGALGGTSIRVVFVVDFALMAVLAAIVHRTMTNDESLTTNDERRTTNGEPPQPTANDGRLATSDQRLTANDPRPTVNDPRPTVNDPRPTVNDPRRTANDPRPTANDPRPTANDQRPSTGDTRR
jgi:hypothetical protein